MAWSGGGRSVAVYEIETGRTRVGLNGAVGLTWAPDGRYLAAVQGGDLVVLDVTTGKKEKIVSGMGKIIFRAW